MTLSVSRVCIQKDVTFEEPTVFNYVQSLLLEEILP